VGLHRQGRRRLRRAHPGRPDRSGLSHTRAEGHDGPCAHPIKIPENPKALTTSIVLKPNLPRSSSCLTRLRTLSVNTSLGTRFS
jgi:hypothetical protein